MLAAERSQSSLVAGGAACVTYVGDRESNLYEAWVRVPTAQRHLLVRACHDRRLQDSATMLYETLSRQPCQGTYTVTVMADQRAGRQAREAWLAVRFIPVTI